MRVIQSPSRCKECKYGTHFTGSGTRYNSKKDKDAYSIYCCNYLYITGESRVFKNGSHKPDYEPGYCNYYIRKKKKKEAT